MGCGALGCEYLKGLSMMGVGVGDYGKVTVTDMDTIELSNLSRQFLFRGTDVGNSKSISGARVVKVGLANFTGARAHSALVSEVTPHTICVVMMMPRKFYIFCIGHNTFPFQC